MLTEEEEKDQGPKFSKLTALSICTHQLCHIVSTTSLEPVYSELNRIARSVAEKRVLQVKLSDLSIG